MLAQHHALMVSRETLRKWMIETGIWLSRKQRRCFHQPRLRREAFGELIQIDGSEHRWFEDRSGACKHTVFRIAKPDAKGGQGINVPPCRLRDILCHREQRYVSNQLTLSYERKRTMLARNEVSEGAVGQHVDIYDFADHRIEVRWKGVSLPYGRVRQGSAREPYRDLENKRLGAALAFIKAQRDLAVPSPRVKTNSEAGGYRKAGKTSVVRTTFCRRRV